jgi:hypothetical protein
VDEALHVHFGCRAEQNRVLGLAFQGHAQRHPFDDAAGVSGIGEVQRQQEARGARRPAGARQNDVAAEDLGTELQLADFERRQHGERQRKQG